MAFTAGSLDMYCSHLEGGGEYCFVVVANRSLTPGLLPQTHTDPHVISWLRHASCSSVCACIYMCVGSEGYCG